MVSSASGDEAAAIAFTVSSSSSIGKSCNKKGPIDAAPPRLNAGMPRISDRTYR
jgi:hypothetical protein